MQKGIVAVAALIFAVACGTSDNAPGDTMQVATTAGPSIQALAGDWSGVTKSAEGDTAVGSWTARLEADGNGWVVVEGSTDTVQFVATVEGDSVIYTSEVHTDAALPPEMGQVTWRAAIMPSGTNSFVGMLQVMTVSNPDSVIARARLEGTKQ